LLIYSAFCDSAVPFVRIVTTVCSALALFNKIRDRRYRGRHLPAKKDKTLVGSGKAARDKADASSLLMAFDPQRSGFRYAITRRDEFTSESVVEIHLREDRL